MLALAVSAILALGALAILTIVYRSRAAGATLSADSAETRSRELVNGLSVNIAALKTQIDGLKQPQAAIETPSPRDSDHPQ